MAPVYPIPLAFGFLPRCFGMHPSRSNECWYLTSFSSDTAAAFNWTDQGGKECRSFILVVVSFMMASLADSASLSTLEHVIRGK
jgi:hypothetical protein